LAVPFLHYFLRYGVFLVLFDKNTLTFSLEYLIEQEEEKVLDELESFKGEIEFK